jgi:hypothetical protein
MDDLAVDVSDHYPIYINCDTDCEQRIDTDTKDGKVPAIFFSNDIHL